MSKIDQQENSGKKCQKQTNRKTVVKNVKSRPIGKQWSKMTKVDQQEHSGHKCQKQTNRNTVVKHVKSRLILYTVCTHSVYTLHSKYCKWEPKLIAYNTVSIVRDFLIQQDVQTDSWNINKLYAFNLKQLRRYFIL